MDEKQFWVNKVERSRLGQAHRHQGEAPAIHLLLVSLVLLPLDANRTMTVQANAL